MRDRALALRVHRNLLEVNAWTGDEPGGEVERRDGTLLFAGPSALPFLNGVMREGPEHGDAAALLARAREFFFARDRGFILFAWPGDPELEAAAEAAGMFDVVEYPEMVCARPLPELEADVRPVADAADARVYWELCDAAYPSLGFPARAFTQSFAAEQLLRADRAWACLGHLDGRPVACASVYVAEGVGLIAWVAVLPEARGRGLAAACTARATNRAFEMGADVASLQASPMGEELYRRLGYEDLFDYRLLGAMPPERLS